MRRGAICDDSPLSRQRRQLAPAVPLDELLVYVAIMEAFILLHRIEVVADGQLEFVGTPCGSDMPTSTIGLGSSNRSARPVLRRTLCQHDPPQYAHRQYNPFHA